GYNEILITLIEAGADVNQTGWSTPLIRAIVSGHTDIVEELIKHGADVNLMPTDGYSPLNEAEYYGNTEIINLLIQAGAKDFEL
ncbi:ankyrin, partial [Rhizophagus irregularis]